MTQLDKGQYINLYTYHTDSHLSGKAEEIVERQMFLWYLQYTNDLFTCIMTTESWRNNEGLSNHIY